MPTLMLRLLQPLGCCNGTAARGLAACRLAVPLCITPPPSHSLCGDGEADHLK
jgi:hypothetical protein